MFGQAKAFRVCALCFGGRLFLGRLRGSGAMAEESSEAEMHVLKALALDKKSDKFRTLACRDTHAHTLQNPLLSVSAA